MGDVYVDLFATKGLEYLLVIAFLVTLVVFWRLLNRQGRPAATSPARPSRVEWFTLVDNLYYHQGHSWARVEDGEVVAVGIDDFAQKLLGKPDALELPPVGSRLEQGAKGWTLRIGSISVNLLSPVDGQVSAVNEEVLKSPELITTDPYGKGWLLKVKASKLNRDRKNLLSGELASAWMDQTVDALRRRMSGNLGVALQDGGMPVSGFVRNLSPDKWDEFASEFLLSK
ncbi:MAG: glycine cleavage system protein H [Bacteroidota bacterium]